MAQKMSWEEMKRVYPDEWLMIVDYETDKSGHLLSGVVERHSRDKGDVYRLPAVDKDCAFRYTGECQFPGGWRAHAECHHV